MSPTRGLILAMGFAATPAVAADVLADAPSNLSVTVYRAPYRASGSIDLHQLGGFALVSETRTVHLPTGLSRLRFEGVADGIEPASAIVTGFPDGVVEKNRDGKVLSPAALLAAAVGKSVTLLRTDRKTGRLSRTTGTIVSDAEGGTVFRSPDGLEALRCSGLPERLSFVGITNLAATPTLSVLVHNSTAATRTVTLAYLTRDFDWAADYVATLSADGKSMDLGAWVTLANGNGIGFPQARTQVVAGRVNRESGGVEPVDAGGPILAQCWPRGSTSDSPGILQFAGSGGSAKKATDKSLALAGAALAPRLEEVRVTALRRVEQEQLGDLKLYLIPGRTTLASRQSKQVRLMDRSNIPVTTVYSSDLGEDAASAAAHRYLRTTNDAANHLGLPLPSGRIAVFGTRDGERLLQHESGIRDLAVDEAVEIDMGDSPDVRVTMVKEAAMIGAGQVPDVTHVDISSAHATPVQFELRLQLRQGGRVVQADHPLAYKNGRPIFRLTIPANGRVTVRYQTR